jgi:CRP-like cAMP-binding protein
MLDGGRSGLDFRLAALDRWPRLMMGFCARPAQQVDRLAAQLVVCQLSRVEDRVLALMWLLAESWGQVTPAGTRLPLDLTHEAIGEMVGARRPTVILAVRALADEGAMVRQERGWLLLKGPEALGSE